MNYLFRIIFLFWEEGPQVFALTGQGKICHLIIFQIRTWLKLTKGVCMATEFFFQIKRRQMYVVSPVYFKPACIVTMSKCLHGNAAPVYLTYQTTFLPDQGELLTFGTMQKGKFMWPFLSTLRKLFEDCCEVLFVWLCYFTLLGREFIFLKGCTLNNL